MGTRVKPPSITRIKLLQESISLTADSAFLRVMFMHWHHPIWWVPSHHADVALRRGLVGLGMAVLGAVALRVVAVLGVVALGVVVQWMAVMEHSARLGLCKATRSCSKLTGLPCAQTSQDASALTSNSLKCAEPALMTVIYRARWAISSALGSAPSLIMRLPSLF